MALLEALLPDRNAALLRRLIVEQGARHWRGYAAAFVCMALIAATTSLAAWLMKDVINKVFMERTPGAVWWLSGLVVSIYVVKGMSTYGQQVILSRIANAIVANVQRRIFRHLLEMDVPYVSGHHSSEFIARQSFIATSCGQVLNTLITTVGRDLLSVIGLLGVMISQDPIMSLIGLAVMPASVVGVQKLSRRAKKIMMTGYGRALEVVEATQETVQGFRLVKAFALEEHMRARAETSIRQVEESSNKLARVGARSTPLMESLGGFAIAGVIFYGGWRVSVDGSTPGTFFSFITALLLLYEPAKRLARVHIDLTASMVGVSIFYEFLDEPAREQEQPGLPDLQIGAGRIEYADVRFHYRPEEEVLRGLDLVAEAGRTTALVGASGGGKSTILSLLLRFWNPTEGTITIDGQPIDGVTRRSLRSAIAFVSQDVVLFKGSVYDNIALGRPGASEAEVIEAAKAAYAHDFISHFQDGYRSAVGENGMQLSGGQRQRIAIARAILKDAPILLLDEATAALDTESERAIQDALERLSHGRTTLVIAHRLQTIQRADKICVIEKGRVVESGRHEELLDLGGRYRRLHDVHFRTEEH